MKATGIVRMLDDLGRIVIPKEIRRSLGVTEGSQMEMFVDEKSGGLVLVPYRSSATSKLRGIAHNLDSLGNTPKHWEIAKEIEQIAKKLEQIEKNI